MARHRADRADARQWSPPSRMGSARRLQLGVDRLVHRAVPGHHLGEVAVAATGGSQGWPGRRGCRGRRPRGRGLQHRHGCRATRKASAHAGAALPAPMSVGAPIRLTACSGSCGRPQVSSAKGRWWSRAGRSRIPRPARPRPPRRFRRSGTGGCRQGLIIPVSISQSEVDQARPELAAEQQDGAARLAGLHQAS